MVTRGRSDSATLLHVFKEILGLEEDSDPIKALAQQGYTDMQDFLSIEDADFADFVVKETIEQTVGGQVSKISVDKQLLKHHIGKMQSLSQWHHHLMSQTGKRLTNDEWHKLTKDAFDDFRVSHHPSTGSLLHPSTQATPQVKQSAMDFKRGIKHEVSQYPTLKDEKYFNQI